MLTDKKGKIRPLVDGLATSDNQTNGSQKTQIVSNEFISISNSSNTPLLANATFTGAWEDVSPYASIALSAYSDVPGTLYADLSPDGVTVTTTLQLSSGLSGQMGFHGLIPTRRYYRIRVVNGVTNQTTFLAQSIYNKNPKISIVTSRISQSIDDYTDVLNTRSVLTGKSIENGLYTNVLTNTDGFLFTSNETYEDSIAEGYVPNHTPHYHIGKTTNVNTTITDIWNGGGIYVFPTVAQKMNVVSTSANDTLAGTGIQKVRITGLDSTYAEISEVISLNGVTPVTTVNSYLRINDFIAEQFGTGGVSAGTITVKDLTNTTTYIEILTGYSKARQMIYTVPLGYRLFIKKLDVSGGVGGNTVKSEFLIFSLKSTWNGMSQINGFTTIREYGVLQGSSVNIYDVPLVFPEKTDIKMSVLGDYAGGATVIASFDGWLDPNN